jgi:2-hydroxy-6-oxonona-2,4-dienedioate hydrolase
MATAQLTQESTSKFVQTKHWKLHYNEAGEGHPVIMLHGTGPGATGWSNFNRNIGPLSEKYRVILLDSPGWGESDTVDVAKFGQARGDINALAVKELMDELGMETAALVGNSMGGGCVQAFNMAFPERLSHFITMGSGAPGTNIIQAGGPLEGIRIIRETYENPTPENFKRLIEVMVYDSGFVTSELAQQRADNALANKEHLANWLKSFGVGGAPAVPNPKLVESLLNCKAPALVFHGRDDRTVPIEGSLRLVTMLPNSTLVVFNKCGHWAQVEHADTFNWMVSEFIAKN